MFFGRVILAAIVLAVAPIASSAAAGGDRDGKLAGLFTFSARGHTDPIRGVVTLTDRSGKVHRIRVNASGRFSERFRPGRYQVSCEARSSGSCQPDRGCGVYLTGDRFKIGNPYHSVSTLRIRTRRATDIRINCFGHG